MTRIKSVPRVLPGVSLAPPTLGVNLTDWLPIPIANIEMSVSSGLVDSAPIMSLIFVPFRLSFNRLGYSVTDIGGGAIQFALYEAGIIAQKLVEVDDTFDSTGPKSAVVEGTLDPGLYWLGFRRSLDPAPSIEVYAATGVSLIEDLLPPDSYRYCGYLPIAVLPDTFSPGSLRLMPGGIIAQPKVRFYTV